MNRLSLINILENVRANRVCCYQGNFCDCKYGGGSTEFNPWTCSSHTTSEQNGCPELRYIIGMLLRTTDEEFASIEARNPLDYMSEADKQACLEILKRK